MTYETSRLIKAVLRTITVDETGDVTFTNFMVETLVGTNQYENWTLNEALEKYLIWANGPKWDPWIWTVKPGDIPPK